MPPSEQLREARETLLSIFRKKFDEASRARDSTTTSRFFKLFPAIGWEDEGLQAYAGFVIDLVRMKAPTTAKSAYINIFIQSDLKLGNSKPPLRSITSVP